MTQAIKPITLRLPNIIVMGREAMPPELAARAGLSQQVHPWNPDQYRSPLQKITARLLDQKGLVEDAGFFLDSLRFSRAYKKLQAELEDNLHPHAMARFVFDAHGRAHLPPKGKLAAIESSLIEPEDPGLPEQAVAQLKQAVRAGLHNILGRHNTNPATDSESSTENSVDQEPDFTFHTQAPALSSPETDLAVLQAFDNAGIVHDFFREHLGVVISQPLIQVVNFNGDALRTSLDNAASIPMLFGAHLVMYGQGDGVRFGSPAAAIDIVGHELGHYYLDAIFPDKFPYYYQAGAINEFIADAIGLAVKAKKQGVVGNNYPESFWRLGGEWLIKPDMGIRHALRPGNGFDHSDYGKDKQPSHMRKFEITHGDSGGVHTNSGIMNRTFNLFAKQVDSPYYDIPLKVLIMAIQIVRPNPAFNDFAEALVQAAREFDKYADCRGMDLQNKMLEACQQTGVRDYVVDLAQGKVVKRVGTV